MGFSSRDLAWRTVLGSAGSAYTPRPTTEIDRWADENYVLVEGVSANPGPWSTDKTPYLRGILQATVDPAVSVVTVMKSSQLGVTEAIIIRLLYAAAVSPMPAMVVYPSKEIAREANRDRILPGAKACKATRAKLGEAEEESGVARLKFGGMPVYLVGSGSEAQLRGKPIGIRIIDEVDLVAPGTCEEMEQRGDTYEDAGGKQFEVGTPSTAEFGAHARYVRGDQRRYFVPCPHCGSYQDLVWENVDWCDGGRKPNANADECEATAWVNCIRTQCRQQEHQGRILNAHKPAMLARGVWIRQGQYLRKREEVRADETRRIHEGAAADAQLGLNQKCPPGYVLLGDAQASRHVSFWIGGLHSPFKTFGKVARTFVESKGNPDRVWWNGVLGRPWQATAANIDLVDLQKLVIPESRGGYRMGMCPDDVMFLTGQVDVQQDSLWVSVYGWTAGAKDQVLVWFGNLPCPMGRGLGVLDGVIDRVYPYKDGSCGRARYWLIDSGYGYRTEDVYSYCRSRTVAGVREVLSIKGDGSSGNVLPFRETIVDRTPDGKPRADGVKLVFLNTGYYKDMVAGAIRASIDMEMGKEVPAEARRVRLPLDAPIEYLAGLTAEHKVMQRVRGNSVWVWQLKAGRKDNHPFDLAYYGFAQAQRLGLEQLGPEHLRRFRVGVARESSDQPRTAPAGPSQSHTRIRAVKSLVT